MQYSPAVLRTVIYWPISIRNIACESQPQLHVACSGFTWAIRLLHRAEWEMPYSPGHCRQESGVRTNRHAVPDSKVAEGWRLLRRRGSCSRLVMCVIMRLLAALTSWFIREVVTPCFGFWGRRDVCGAGERASLALPALQPAAAARPPMHVDAMNPPLLPLLPLVSLCRVSRFDESSLMPSPSAAASGVDATE